MISQWNTPNPLGDVLMRGDDGFEIGQYILGRSEFCTHSYYDSRSDRTWELTSLLCPPDNEALQQQIGRGFAYWNGPYVAVLTLLCVLFLLTILVSVLLWQRQDMDGMIGRHSTPLFLQPHWSQALQMHRAAAQQQQQQPGQAGAAPTLFMAEVGPDGQPRWGPRSYFTTYGTVQAQQASSEAGAASTSALQPPLQQQSPLPSGSAEAPQPESTTSQGKGKGRAVEQAIAPSVVGNQAGPSSQGIRDSQYITAI